MTQILKDGGKRSRIFDPQRFQKSIQTVFLDYPHLQAEPYIQSIQSIIELKKQMSSDEIINTSILKALEQINVPSEDTHPDWTFIAAKLYLKKLYHDAANNRAYDPMDRYGSLYGLLKKLGSSGIYSELILRDYSQEEIKLAQSWIDPSKDHLFTYVGLKTLADRYLAKGYNKEIMELPQERFMIIALVLMSKQNNEKRMEYVKQAYWALSNLYMTVATPTLSNAGKSYGQLSSCFIDTIDDSLRGIYDSNTDIATLSKSGGGIGVYMGKIRALESDIRGFKGVSSGIVPWAKQLNNTAVSVDQLGQRQGSIAIYLDVWHKDIYRFLDLKLNNGDERQRAHDLFTGVCLPDLFMEAVEERKQWFLFDPHEIRKKKGWSLEDCFDEQKGSGTFRKRYEELIHDPEISKIPVEAIDIMKKIMKSQLESGTPYMFYRDTVNRANPNKHKGMIYCSNLCTEITQNMSATVVAEEIITDASGDAKILTVKQPGDFVVCNLSSINLAKAVMDDVLSELIPIQVRMLDAVIDLNSLDVKQAQLTNQRYRAIGLGTFGWHHLLALKSIVWESDEAVTYADQLYEQISYLTIQASVDLAKEFGTYPYFQGSDWSTGEYFLSRGLSNDPKWKQLMQECHQYGIRNGYLMAIAPNGSTSVIAGSTASIDPIYKRFFTEEKKNYVIPVTAPDLSAKTYWFYKPAVDIDQNWSIDQNAARQKHIDQSISFNLYVKHDIHARDFLNLHLHAWKSGLKTTYYTRSTSIQVEECESCAS